MSRRSSGVNDFGLTLKQKLFIKALTRELGWGPDHLRNFIHKYYRRDGLDSLTRKEASHLIESLKGVRAHESRAGRRPDQMSSGT